MEALRGRAETGDDTGISVYNIATAARGAWQVPAGAPGPVVAL
jgi:hypothetical protein